MTNGATGTARTDPGGGAAPPSAGKPLAINADTKIAALLRGHGGALEAIIRLSPKFNKLRNPLLRKLMASRTTIRMASKIGGCTPADFFRELAPLGFIADRASSPAAEEVQLPPPPFMAQLGDGPHAELDVRPLLEAGQDPFNRILQEVKALAPGQVLRLVNDFEPLPLIQLLGKQGLESWTEVMPGGVYRTYFHKGAQARMPAAKAPAGDDFEARVQQFADRTRTIDVRHLEMPLPMLTILEALEELPAGHALYVHHKRIPVFLLPELEERKFQYRAQELGEGNVKLFIFRP